MKRTYTKPEIVFEDFTLSTNIAAGCEVRTDTQARGQCGYAWGGKVLFLDGVAGCSDIIKNDGEFFNGLCYHNPSDLNNLFNS